MDCGIVGIVKYVGDRIGKIGNFIIGQIKFKDTLEKFKGSKDYLSKLIDEIEAKLNRELHNGGRVAKHGVRRWLFEAKEFIRRPAVEDEVDCWGCLSCCCRRPAVEDEVNNWGCLSCCCRCLSCCCRRRLLCCCRVRILEERDLELKKLNDQGDRYTNECLVIAESSASLFQLTFQGSKAVIVKGSKAVIVKFLKWLGGAKETKLGVWGMGGVGKTTIMMQVHNELLTEGKFKKVIWVTVSQNFDIYNLQEQIASSLGENLQELQDTIINRAAKLSKILEKHMPYLLILDDVWSSFKLEDVGIPEPNVTNGCKLVLTTQSQEVARLMDCRSIQVKTLSEDDAFQILKFSYDRLENQQIKNCFLYCALYPEDYEILVEKIIENWIDEGFIDEMESRQSMKDEGYGILRKLEDNSLLEFIEDEVKGDCVRMHDFIRDMALDITSMSPRFLVEAGKRLRELPEKVKCTEDVEKVSLMHNYIEEIPSSMASSTCRRLTTLLLAHNSLLTIPESVFEHMPELKILDLSFNQQLSSLPNSICKLVKLTTLLLESTSLEKVPSLSGLGSLKKLNLRGTKIKEVPEGLGMLKNLTCLFLCGSTYGYILEIDEIASEVLSNLSKLQELSLEWSRIKLKGDVVGRLKKLEVFHGWFPTANEMTIFLKCQPNRLSDYFIAVGSKLATMNMIGYFGSGKLRLGYKKVVVFKETSIVGENMLFPSIQILGIVACHDIRSLNDFSTINDATDLRECWIQNCERMECIFPSWINNLVVQTLEYLRLDELHKLDGLFEANVTVTSSPPPGTFSSLKEVEIRDCKKIKKLFPSWKLVEYLQTLEEIDVRCCEEMEEIIGSDPEEEGEEGGDIIKKLILPKLRKLKLGELPALKSICSRRAVIACDYLEYITIYDCKGLRRIPLYLPLVDNAQPSPPPSLKKINIRPQEQEWWESLEWDHPNAKDVLRPMVQFVDDRIIARKLGISRKSRNTWLI